jgi:GntR family transcriptional regulator
VPSRKLIRNPLYEQLRQILKELITSDEFQVDDKFLTERQISERFDVSRVTANKALASLVAEGLLAFRKGLGTFVKNASPDSRTPSAATSFTNKTLAAGRSPTTRLLRFEHSSAERLPTRVRQRLPVDEGEPMIIVERLRLADEVPMILERHHLRARFLPGLAPEDVLVSLYDTLTKKYRLPLAVMDETIRASVIRGSNAALLEVADGTPGILMHFMPHTDEGVPVYFAEVLYRGDAFEFHNRLGPIQRTHSLTDDPDPFTAG